MIIRHKVIGFEIIGVSNMVGGKTGLLRQKSWFSVRITGQKNYGNLLYIVNFVVLIKIISALLLVGVGDIS